MALRMVHAQNVKITQKIMIFWVNFQKILIRYRFSNIYIPFLCWQLPKLERRTCQHTSYKILYVMTGLIVCEGNFMRKKGSKHVCVRSHRGEMQLNLLPLMVVIWINVSWHDFQALMCVKLWTVNGPYFDLFYQLSSTDWFRYVKLT